MCVSASSALRHHSKAESRVALDIILPLLCSTDDRKHEEGKSFLLEEASQKGGWMVAHEVLKDSSLLEKFSSGYLGKLFAACRAGGMQQKSADLLWATFSKKSVINLDEFSEEEDVFYPLATLRGVAERCISPFLGMNPSHRKGGRAFYFFERYTYTLSYLSVLSGSDCSLSEIELQKRVLELLLKGDNESVTLAKKVLLYSLNASIISPFLSILTSEEAWKPLDPLFGIELLKLAQATTFFSAEKLIVYVQRLALLTGSFAGTLLSSLDLTVSSESEIDQYLGFIDGFTTEALNAFFSDLMKNKLADWILISIKKISLFSKLTRPNKIAAFVELTKHRAFSIFSRLLENEMLTTRDDTFPAETLSELVSIKTSGKLEFLEYTSAFIPVLSPAYIAELYSLSWKSPDTEALSFMLGSPRLSPLIPNAIIEALFIAEDGGANNSAAIEVLIKSPQWALIDDEAFAACMINATETRDSKTLELLLSQRRERVTPNVALSIYLLRPPFVIDGESLFGLEKKYSVYSSVTDEKFEAFFFELLETQNRGQLRRFLGSPLFTARLQRLRLLERCDPTLLENVYSSFMNTRTHSASYLENEVVLTSLPLPYLISLCIEHAERVYDETALVATPSHTRPIPKDWLYIRSFELNSVVTRFSSEFISEIMRILLSKKKYTYVKKALEALKKTDHIKILSPEIINELLKITEDRGIDGSVLLALQEARRPRWVRSVMQTLGMS